MLLELIAVLVIVVFVVQLLQFTWEYLGEELPTHLHMSISIFWPQARIYLDRGHQWWAIHFICIHISIKYSYTH